MVDRPKPRRYDSPRRSQQAAATRTEILEAALRLFEQRGYTATTMAAIAAEAGVALKTVYLAFQTKRGLLLALWHLRLRGDERPVPVGERPWFREVIDEPDPARHAAPERAQFARRQGTRRAVARDPAERRFGGRRARRALEADPDGVLRQSALPSWSGCTANNALRPGLEVDRGADILWALNHPDLYRLLVGDRGWTPKRYEEWLGDAFCAQLL